MIDVFVSCERGVFLDMTSVCLTAEEVSGSVVVKYERHTSSRNVGEHLPIEAASHPSRPECCIAPRR